MLAAEPQGGAAPARWASVLALALSQTVAWGALYYAYAVFSTPLAEGLGLSPQVVAAAFSMTMLISGFAAGAVGRLMDERGSRWALLLGGIVGPLALAALACSIGPVTLFLSFALLGIAFSLGLYDAALRAIVEWVPAGRSRSRALLLLTSIAGFASTVFLPLTVRLVAAYGWRGALLILAALVASVTMPVALALPRRAREIASSAGTVGASPLRRGIGAVSAAFALHAMASTGMAVCLVWHLASGGVALETAAFSAGLLGAAQVPGRLLLGPLQRVLPSAFRVPLLFAAQAVALVLIAVQLEPNLTRVAILVCGAASGAMTIERAVIVSEWFGDAQFGRNNGHVARISAFAKAAAPFTVELARRERSYRSALTLLALLLAVGGVLLFLVSRRRIRELP